MIRVSPATLDGFVARVEIDPSFHAVLSACRLTSTPIAIVSDGFDLVIHSVLARHGIRNVPVFANQLRPFGADRWRLLSPNAADGCDAGVCKCDVTCTQGRPFAFVGDGRSDFCVVSDAAVIFAKAQLAAHCRERGLSFVPFANLDVVADWLLSVAPGQPLTESLYG